MGKWAIDFGTSNSTVARWDEEALLPSMVQLHDICREKRPQQRIEIQHTIPSAVYLLPGEDWKTRLGKLPWFQRYFFLGRQGLIGRAALERDAGLLQSNFIQGFKRALLKDGYFTVARVGGQTFPAARVAKIFLREIFNYIHESRGERVRDLAIAVPVDSYEPYRAQIRRMARQLGVRRLSLVDEPVAAALGYGLSISEAKNVLVLDFGGGTLDLALIRMEESGVETGRCDVLAKVGLPLGGTVVDAWLVDEFCKTVGYQVNENGDDDPSAWWYRIMLEEACRVKEGLYFNEKERFFLAPPVEMRRVPSHLFEGGRFAADVSMTRSELEALLTKRGLYDVLKDCYDNIAEQARARGIDEEHIDEVLMIGGSTLLPRVYIMAEQRYGRDRVRAWQPFDAVGYGACAHAARHYVRSDFIIHDYAFVTYRREGESMTPEYQTIIKAGTSFPTEGAVWKRHLTPSCARGESERIFKLVIVEIARYDGVGQKFVWDKSGGLIIQEGGTASSPVVVPLNEEDPALGHLDPPHPPRDRSPRLEISFGINEERWLWCTVYDLKAGKLLMEEAPVVRLK